MKSTKSYSPEEVHSLKKTMHIRQVITWVFLTIGITLGASSYINALGSVMGNSSIKPMPYDPFIGLSFTFAAISAVMELMALEKYLKTTDKKWALFLKTILFSLAIGFAVFTTLVPVILFIISKL